MTTLLKTCLLLHLWHVGCALQRVLLRVEKRLNSFNDSILKKAHVLNATLNFEELEVATTQTDLRVSCAPSAFTHNVPKTNDVTSKQRRSSLA